MIFPRSLAAPIALLVALCTATIVFDAGIAASPARFFGDDSVLIIGPEGGEIPGRSEIAVPPLAALRALPSVRVVSPEIFELLVLDGRSTLVRGVDHEAFLDLEGGRIVEGRAPRAAHEAIAGAGFARTFDIDLPARIVVPSSFGRYASPVDVVGIFEMEGPARDELLIPLDDARALMGMSPDEAHVVRIDTTDPANLSRLLASVGPSFTYHDVRLSANDLIPGEPVVMRANLTNWGRIGAVRDVEVKQDERVLASRAYFVEGRQTIPVEVTFYLDQAGSTNVTVNPTLPVHVRDPTAFFTDVPPSVAAGAEYQIRVVDGQGSPAAGIAIEAGSASATTDSDGRALLTAPASGTIRLVAIVDGHAEGATRIPVAARGYEDAAHLVPVELRSLEPLAGTTRPIAVRLLATNDGGRTGLAEFTILLDGEPHARTSLSAQPGETVGTEISIGPLSAGQHRISVDGASAELSIRAYPGEDPRVEALLEGYEIANAVGAPRTDVTEDASDYVSKIVGNVRIAVLALSIASGSLSALGVIAVLHRHIAEREPRLGALKAIGATNEWILGVATREAGITGLVGAAGGIAAGVALAEALNATGLVRAFGHEVGPVYEWYALALLFVLAVLFVVLASRALVGVALRTPVDALLRGSTLRPVAREPPTLHEITRRAP